MLRNVVYAIRQEQRAKRKPRVRPGRNDSLDHPLLRAVAICTASLRRRCAYWFPQPFALWIWPFVG